MKFYLHIFLLLVLVQTLSFSEVIKSGSFQATSDGNRITLCWVTVKEAGVIRFEVERRARVEGDFVAIGNVDPKGPSLYEFIDYSALGKTAVIYQYRIKIVFSNNTVMYSSTVTVSHTVSGIRRTWGSIKAMFR